MTMNEDTDLAQMVCRLADEARAPSDGCYCGSSVHDKSSQLANGGRFEI